MLILFCTQHLEVRLVSNFFSNCLSLFPFGIHIITPSFCVDDNSPFLNPSFNELTMKAPNCNQKNLKNSTVKPSDPGLLLFFIFLSAALASSKVIFPSSEVFSCNVKVGMFSTKSDISHSSTGLSEYNLS